LPTFPRLFFQHGYLLLEVLNFALYRFCGFLWLCHSYSPHLKVTCTSPKDRSSLVQAIEPDHAGSWTSPHWAQQPSDTQVSTAVAMAMQYVRLLSRGVALAREQRKLAAIVAADVVGYSRLMGRDESGTLARLRRNRSEHLDPILRKYGGRLVKLTGDGALIEF